MSLEFLVREINLVERKIKRKQKELNYEDVEKLVCVKGEIKELEIILSYLLELREREFGGERCSK